MAGRSGTKRGRREGGNVLIEFALIGSLMFLMLGGVIGVSRVYAAANIVASAARAGTQYGMLSPAHYGDTTGMQTAALADAGTNSGLTVTASNFCTCSIGGAAYGCPVSCGTGTQEEYIKVVTSIPFNTIIPVPGFPQSMAVGSMSIVRVQ